MLSRSVSKSVITKVDGVDHGCFPSIMEIVEMQLPPCWYFAASPNVSYCAWILWVRGPSVSHLAGWFVRPISLPLGTLPGDLCCFPNPFNMDSHNSYRWIYHKSRFWLVVLNNFYFYLFIQFGISSSQLTFTPSFFRGVGQRPTSTQSRYPLVN